ncbi:MAG: 4Fe-4S binding protein [Pseudomonadota bacterium]|nr:MAG: 4Fe-4S binding protein [Pseudomonadota bacterium]
MATGLAERAKIELSEETANGRARAKALSAARKVAARPTSAVAYRSTGAAVIIGPHEAAVPAASRLHPQVRCTVVVHPPAGAASTATQPTTGRAVKSEKDFPVVHEKVVQVSGHLGQYAVIVSAPPPAGGANLLQKLGSQRTHFDLVLDLTDPPFIRQELLPFGYYAPGKDAQALERALLELPEMIGEFEKPRFFNYNPDICAHGESGLTGCTRCLDACPANAIISMHGEVAVDPHLCQGAGLCATVCPTGAMTYVYPTVADQLARASALLKMYLKAGGSQPIVLLHDAESGAERIAALAPRLPEHVLPMQLAELGSLGMEAWLSMLAHGASQVALLPTATTGASVLGATTEQITYSSIILDGMGYGSNAIRLLSGDDAAVLDQLRAPAAASAQPAATFAPIDEKRTLLRLAIEHLHANAPQPRAEVALPDGAPFGEIIVDRVACTLCMACVGVCPVSALSDGADLPQLNFVEANCVQCGLCQTACPEDAIRRAPRYLYDAEARRATRVLNEETPFHCVACGKPFATHKMMERMLEKLEGHWMYRDPTARRRMQMCGDCRVRDVFRAGQGHPGGHLQ